MKELYCITCPMGCHLTIKDDGPTPVIEGNTCKRGADFAMAELTNPVRTLTTTVRTTFPGIPVLPVRTDGEIPKKKIMDVMQALKSVVIRMPLECGDTVVGNVAGTGVKVIAASDALVMDYSKIGSQARQVGENGETSSGAPAFGTKVTKASLLKLVEIVDAEADDADEEDKTEEEDEAAAAAAEAAAAAKAKEEEERRKSRGRARLTP